MDKVCNVGKQHGIGFLQERRRNQGLRIIIYSLFFLTVEYRTTIFTSLIIIILSWLRVFDFATFLFVSILHYALMDICGIGGESGKSIKGVKIVVYK